MKKKKPSNPPIAPVKKGVKKGAIPPIAPVKKGAKAETVTLRQLATALAESHGIAKAQANAMIADMVLDIAKHLKKGKRIRLNGLGILQVRDRPARMGRNPATGEAIKIKASKKIAFRAAKDLKAAI
jgi:DNA-binding protein HU-beta